MTKTVNYNLKKPEPNDPLRVADFNENADIIDAALNSLNTAVGNKAEQSAVAVLSTALEGKGNCRIATGSYVGTGTYGANNPVLLTFDFVPKVVFVAEAADVFRNSVIFSGAVKVKMSPGYVTVVRSGNSIGWYHDSDADTQFNYSGSQYTYVALGCDE